MTRDNPALVKLDECVEWQGAKSADGYGRAGKGYAHREAYQAVRGPIPDGMEIDHLCRNRGCVNPDHLEAVTHAENIRRAHPVPPHGTRTRYDKYGCRCDECREANNAYFREYLPRWRASRGRR